MVGGGGGEEWGCVFGWTSAAVVKCSVVVHNIAFALVAFFVVVAGHC